MNRKEGYKTQSKAMGAVGMFSFLPIFWGCNDILSFLNQFFESGFIDN